MREWRRKYDDADWHYGSDDYPPDLAVRHACTHIGMFIVWAYDAGLLRLEDARATVGRKWFEELRRDAGSFGEMTENFFDGKLSAEDLTDEGWAFADWYYDRYLREFTDFLPEDAASPYLLPDNIDNFRKISALLDKRLAEFRLPPAQRPRPPGTVAALGAMLHQVWERIVGGRA
jgi:hypothetical protein